MKQIKNKAKRMLAVLVSLVLVVGMLPVSAFALTESALFGSHIHLNLNSDGNFQSKIDIDTTSLSVNAFLLTEDKTINTWVQSPEMTSNGDTDGSIPPYFTDASGKKWVLDKVALAEYTPAFEEFQLKKHEIILTSEEIQLADSRDDYVVDVSDVKLDATSAGPGTYLYSIYYGWKCEDDGGGLTDPESYTVTYDFTLPDGLTDKNVTVYPLLEYNGKETLSIGETDGSLSQVKTALEDLEGKVYSGQPYQVPYVDDQFIGFLVFDRTRNSADEENRNYNGFYKFTGWKVEGATNESAYPIGSTINDISDLSTGNNNEIKFVPKWEEITPLEDTAVAADAEKLPLNLFRGNVSGVSGLLSQWVNNDKPTDEDVTLGEGDILHYQVSTLLNSQLIYAWGGYNEQFAEFVLTINLDKNLEFANLDDEGNATITVEPGPLKVTQTNLGDVENNKVTFNPANITGNTITITLGWDTGANVTSVDPTVITGLDFKLKDVATGVSSSANITGYLDYYNQTIQNPRFHYEAAQDLLNSTFWVENAEGGSNTKLWYEHFKAAEDYITAFVHTLQVLDYKVKDIDLSEGNIGQVEANTVNAKITHTITATAGNNGTITPSGEVSVTDGANQSFTITPDSGYQIADVKVDGKSEGAVNTYTFTNVTANHTIEATFEKKPTKPIDPPYIPPVDPDEPADPDDTGVSDLLNTEDHIQYLFGYPDGTFGPENNMTRAEVAQMFYNLLLDQDVEITKTFDDVPANAWYTKAVNTLASLDIISGVGDNKFEPERSITRAEFTAMAMKFAVGGEEGENIFSDVDENDWFYEAVVNSIQYGWIHGYGDGTFRPNNPITRAEVTAIVNNMLGRAADEDFVDEHAEELTQFSDIEKHWAYYHIVEATNDHDYTKPSSGENWTKLN